MFGVYAFDCLGISQTWQVSRSRNPRSSHAAMFCRTASFVRYKRNPLKHRSTAAANAAIRSGEVWKLFPKCATSRVGTGAAVAPASGPRFPVLANPLVVPADTSTGSEPAPVEVAHTADVKPKKSAVMGNIHWLLSERVVSKMGSGEGCGSCGSTLANNGKRRLVLTHLEREIEGGKGENEQSSISW